MSRTIKLYYQTADNNFGDALSPLIVTAVTGRECCWAPPHAADLVAIGSLMERVILKRWRRPFYGGFSPLLVWGTGFIAGGDVVKSTFLSCRALRGRFTQGRISGAGEELALGDPGLLVPRLFSPEPTGTGGGVLVAPHLKDRGAWADAVMQNDGLKASRISLSDDAMEIIGRIASADLVVTSAMHPLIVALAFDRPAIWVAADKFEVQGGSYKFHDFYSIFDMKPEPAEPEASYFANANFDQLMAHAWNYAVSPAQVDGVSECLLRALTV
jgi:hypothetical protein